MPTYNFSAITVGQALAFTGSDTLILDLAGPHGTRVLFAAADQFTLVAGDRTVVFSAGLTEAAKSFAGGGALFIGTGGDDQRMLDAGTDALFGGMGADTLAGGAGDDLLQGNQGGDSLHGGAGYDVIYGGQGNDIIDTGDGSTTGFAQGNRGEDTILGSASGSDTIIGGQGADLLNALATESLGDGAYADVNGRIGTGADVLNGNLGDDTIFSGYGDDRVLGEDGDDYLFDYGGRNTIDGGTGADTMIDREAFGSHLLGGAGNDLLIVAGTSTIDAGAGDDAIGFFTFAGGGPATRIELAMGDGDDVCILYSDVWSDLDRFTVDGGAGDDFINTSDGSDSISGGAGSDIIDGYAGADTVAGGVGADTFEFFSGEALTVLATLDQVIDWSIEDRLYFADEGGDAIGSGQAFNYVSAERSDYEQALAFANSQIAGGITTYVAVEVGFDVFVFSDSDYDAGVADSAVRLVGCSLADIGFANFTEIGI